MVIVLLLKDPPVNAPYKIRRENGGPVDNQPSRVSRVHEKSKKVPNSVTASALRASPRCDKARRLRDDQVTLELYSFRRRMTTALKTVSNRKQQTHQGMASLKHQAIL